MHRGCEGGGKGRKRPRFYWLLYNYDYYHYNNYNYYYCQGLIACRDFAAGQVIIQVGLFTSMYFEICVKIRPKTSFGGNDDISDLKEDPLLVTVEKEPVVNILKRFQSFISWVWYIIILLLFDILLYYILFDIYSSFPKRFDGLQNDEQQLLLGLYDPHQPEVLLIL